MQQCSLRRRLCHGCVNHVELDQGRRRGCRVPVESAVPPAPSEWRGTVGPMHHLQRFYPDSWLLDPIQEGALNIVLGVAITRVLSFVRRLTISGIATFKSCLRRIPRQKRHRYLPRARTTILPSSCPGLVANMLRAAAPAAEVAADTPAEALSNSGAAVLAIPGLVARICTGLGSAADGANLRQACKQTASSLDWFDLMWCARQDTPKVHTAIKQHASAEIPVDRIKRTITGGLGDVWSCPPLLKWVVLQAAKQGDAELLGAVLGRKQQPQTSKQQLQQHADKPQLVEQAGQQQQQQQQQEEEQQGRTDVRCRDMVQNELRLYNALKNKGNVLRELWFPAALAKNTPSDGRPGAYVWLTAVAAEDAVHSNNTQLLVQMVQEGWFQEPLAKWSSDTTMSLSELLSGEAVTTSVKQQLGPAFLAAAAAGDVKEGKVLLSYCPDLLDYALWNSPAVIQATIIDDHLWFHLGGDRNKGPFLEVLPFVSRLHMGGFQGIKLTDNLQCVLVDLCHHNQRHQPESVQMLLDLGVPSYKPVFYRASTGVSPKQCFACPIVAVAIAERNAGAVAVLGAAGAVLPAHHGAAEYYMPFSRADLHAVVATLEKQAAAAAGCVKAAEYQGAADVLRVWMV